MLKKLLNTFRKETNTSYDDSALMDTYTRLPVSFVRGEGSILWDENDKQYLDAFGGLAVNILGHSQPKVSEAISLQASKLLHVSNLFQIQEQSKLARKFCEIAQMDKVFFTNTDAEANEAAIKIAHRFGQKNGVNRPTILTTKPQFKCGDNFSEAAILSTSNNMHGETELTSANYKFIHVGFDDIDQIGKHASNQNIVAVMIELIRGEAGYNACEKGYLQSLRMICDEHGWLLIVDDIQAGMGRTGKWFSYQHEEVLPDIMTCAKGLANGIPIGACAARGTAAEVLTPGSHSSTFGGNPFACQVALTTIDVIEEGQLVAAAEKTGSYLKKQIAQRVGTHPKVSDIRGKGLILAIELDQAYPNLSELLLEEGLLANITHGGMVICLLPAINTSQTEAKSIARIIHNVIIKLD